MASFNEENLAESVGNLNIRDNELQELIRVIDEMRQSDGSCENTVFYTTYCKLAAQLCHKENSYSEMVYYLSESHAALLRQICCRRRVMYPKQNCYKSNFDDQYTSFRSSYADAKFEGLCRRIEELPEEWTTVQITQGFVSGEGWRVRKSDEIVDHTALHIVRYNCGKKEVPLHVYIPPLSNACGSESILKLLHSSVLDKSLHLNRHSKPKDVRIKRLNNCDKLKEITREISNTWLKEWRCLLLGKICDKSIGKSIEDAVNEVFTSSEVKLAEHKKLLIHQIANGCGFLVKVDIENALNQLVEDGALKNDLLECILKLQNQFANLYYAKRYPVILLIDEKLQCVPWEETLGLRRQPISRLPSVHFVQALYKMHKDQIVDGNVLISGDLSGYYIINPDQTLGSTEKRMVDFLKKRLHLWQGVVGSTSSKEEVTEAVTKHDIFLYCGHGSGIQYIKSSKLFTLSVKAIPLLFGCGSVEYKDPGGRMPFTCYANSYMISGSPCVLGMLWPVTNTDTDNMALALLNHWMPGKPVEIDGLEEFSQEGRYLSNTEPELLRAIRLSRSVANLYFNSCAMVVHGLPVKIK